MLLAGEIEPTDTFNFPSLPMDPDKVIALTQSLVDAGITYKLDGKIEPLSQQAGDLAGNGITGVDCSGFVRWCIFHATDQTTAIIDGSVQQHEQIDSIGFKPSTFADAGLDDGAIRIGFLRPQDTTENIGHVVLITGGQTCESYGGHGPGRRAWGSQGFMEKMFIYVLTPPSS